MSAQDLVDKYRRGGEDMQQVEQLMVHRGEFIVLTAQLYSNERYHLRKLRGWWSP